MKNNSVVVKSGSAFEKFCAKCFKNMNADKRNEIIGSVMTDEIVKVLEDSVLSDTIESFFDNNLNLSETSKKCFIHRNTLVYRLNKIHSLTGLDIRNFDDAVSFKLFMWLVENK